MSFCFGGETETSISNRRLKRYILQIAEDFESVMIPGSALRYRQEPADPQIQTRPARAKMRAMVQLAAMISPRLYRGASASSSQSTSAVLTMDATYLGH